MDGNLNKPVRSVANGILVVAALAVFIVLTVSLQDLWRAWGTREPGDREPRSSKPPKVLPPVESSPPKGRPRVESKLARDLPLVKPEEIAVRCGKGGGYENPVFDEITITYEAPNDYVIYRSSLGNHKEVSVNDEELIGFVKLLNKAGFAAWNARYRRTATDGSAWSLRVKLDGVVYHSMGDSTSDVPDYESLNLAVCRLIKDYSISLCHGPSNLGGE